MLNGVSKQIGYQFISIPLWISVASHSHWFLLCFIFMGTQKEMKVVNENTKEILSACRKVTITSPLECHNTSGVTVKKQSQLMWGITQELKRNRCCLLILIPSKNIGRVFLTEDPWLTRDSNAANSYIFLKIAENTAQAARGTQIGPHILLVLQFVSSVRHVESTDWSVTFLHCLSTHQ